MEVWNVIDFIATAKPLRKLMAVVDPPA